jgi:hypothetical protein
VRSCVRILPCFRGISVIIVQYLLEGAVGSVCFIFLKCFEVVQIFFAAALSSN